jgi:hypothetical protein
MNNWIPNECIYCSGKLCLGDRDRKNYCWVCSNGCLPVLDTGVSTELDIQPFRGLVVQKQSVAIAAASDLGDEHAPGVRIYMPSLLYHFISCTWGGCYNGIYRNCLVPFLDSPEVVDYVLRSDVIRSSHFDGNRIREPRIFRELWNRLEGVSSPRISQYLKETFHDAS